MDDALGYELSIRRVRFPPGLPLKGKNMAIMILIGVVCIGVPLFIYLAGSIKYRLQKGRWEKKFRVIPAKTEATPTK